MQITHSLISRMAALRVRFFETATPDADADALILAEIRALEEEAERSSHTMHKEAEQSSQATNKELNHE